MKSTENRATIYDVAKLAKVSAATVSRVLEGVSSGSAAGQQRQCVHLQARGGCGSRAEI